MAKRGRPAKKIVKHNPTYSRLKVKKVLQDYFMDDPHNLILMNESKTVIKEVLIKLDE
jgi:hypothetical protein